MSKDENKTSVSVLRKRRELITMLGAFIVVFTFMVKSNREDIFRSSSESLERAVSDLAIDQNIFKTRSAIAGLEHRLDEIVELSGRRKNSTRNRDHEFIKRETAIVIDTLDRIHEMEGYTKQVLETIPHAQPEEALMRVIERKSREISEQTEVIKSLNLAKVDERTIKRNIDQLTLLAQSTEDIAVSVAKNSLDLSEDYRWYVDHSYQFYKRLGYLLYLVGFGVGIWGRLYRIDAVQ